MDKNGLVDISVNWDKAPKWAEWAEIWQGKHHVQITYWGRFYGIPNNQFETHFVDLRRTKHSRPK